MVEKSEWPKEWSEIRQSNGESGLESFTTTWMEYQDGVRGYEGTLYMSESVGRETEENVDEWMPFEVYIQEKIKQL